MRFTTEDGREVNVGLNYAWGEIPRYPGVQCRQTVIWLQCAGNVRHPKIDIEERAICSPFDMFSKRVGRLRVRQKFLATFETDQFTDAPGMPAKLIRVAPKQHFSRNDRRLIYQAIMPEWNHKKKRRPKKRSIEETEDRVDSMAGIHKIEGDGVLHIPTNKGDVWHPTAG